jgi:hypothetical protein
MWACSGLCGRGHLDALVDAVRLPGVDLLARLLDGTEDSLVVQTGLRDDKCLLLVEGDFVRLDAYSKFAFVSLKLKLPDGMLGDSQRGEELTTQHIATYRRACPGRG